MTLRLRITRVANGKGNSKYCLHGLKTRGKKRRRKYFRTKAEAEEFKKSMTALYAREGYEGSELSHDERVVATVCIRKLARIGMTLDEATSMALRNSTAVDRSVTIESGSKAFLVALKSDGRKERYISDVRQVLKKFCGRFGKKAVCEISTPEANDWLRDLPVGSISRNNHRRILHAFYSFSCNNGFSATNPITKTTIAKEPEPKRETIPAEALKVLLDNSPPDVMIVFAIAAFAGIRTSEISALDWRNIDLEQRHIEVDSAIAKRTSQRFVPISDNLFAWLSRHAKKTGKIMPANFKRKSKSARIDAGGHLYNEWTGEVFKFKNHLRHSYGTNRLPILQDEKKLAREMGNSVSVIHKHYAKPIPEATARRYWEIFPN